MMSENYLKILLDARVGSRSIDVKGFGSLIPSATHILHVSRNASQIITNFASQNQFSVLEDWKFRRMEREKEFWWTNLDVHLC